MSKRNFLKQLLYQTVIGVMNNIIRINHVFDIIVSKKKKGNISDSEKIKLVLLKLENELQIAGLWELNNRYKNILWTETIEKRK